MHVDLNYNSSSDVKYFTLATGKILQCDLQNEEMHNTPTCAENKKWQIHLLKKDLIKIRAYSITNPYNGKTSMTV